MDEMPKRIGLSDMDGSRYLTFGSLFILAIDSLLFPLDTLKTIIMSERRNKLVKSNAGLLGRTWQIARREGIARFWRGMTPSVLGSFPGQAAYYLAYESTQEALKPIFPPDSDTNKFSTFSKGFLAGAFAN
jgi:hypothetical protein